MKFFINFILLSAFLFCFNSISYSKNGSEKSNIKEAQEDSRLVNPLYELRARNLVLSEGLSYPTNIYFFDIMINHTNLPESGPFEYAAGKYILSYSWLVRLFGPVTYEIVPFSSDFTNPDAVPVNPHVDGNRLILDKNPNLIPGQGPIIATDGIGTRVVRMKITTAVPFFFNIPLNLKWVSNPADSATTQVFAFVGDSLTNITSGGTNVVEGNDVAALYLKAAISGLYNVQTNSLRVRDTLRVYQHSVTPPYNVIDSAFSIVDSISLRGIFNFPNIATGVYYSVVRYKNGLETWSRSGGDSLIRGDQVSYDFTDDSTKAFGNNLERKGNIYCIYSGDVNQNGIIDLQDLALIENSILDFTYGYSANDINGDNFVDLTDAQITDNFVNQFITVIKP
ncbi:MAG TPA: hypothetical protein PK536_10105 [Ignavibacteria bacterium]|nr:hypothetical protein [Bacteroidota bacterium]HRI85784.1 hypothetical protein [Ignavibacteria bacterium]HRK00263.1 hypothetical protein [Ignavibacteria bacterium]